MPDHARLAAEGYVKIRMSDDDGFTETAWAVRVDADWDHFRLDNAPFYAYRVSTDDVVEGRFVSEGFYDFVRVVERSGNRTVRVILGDENAEAPGGRQILAEVVALGCSFEGMFNNLISITVPPSVSLKVVAEYLSSTGRQWEYADPTHSDLFGEA